MQISSGSFGKLRHSSARCSWRAGRSAPGILCELMALALSFPLATALTATTFVHGPRVTHPLALAHRARRSTDVVSTIAVFGASGRTGSEVVLQAMERGEKVSCLVRDRTRLKAPRDSAALGCRAGSMNNFTPTMNEQMARTEGTVLSLGLGLSLGLSLSLSLGLRLRLRLRLSQSLSLSLGLSLSLSLRLRLRPTQPAPLHTQDTRA